MSDHTPIDFVGLNAALLDRAETVVSTWLPNGFRRGHHWYVGDFDGSKGKSANVNLKTGTWIDNGATDDKGGDLISLYARVYRKAGQADAARELMRDNGWQTAPPVQTPAKRKRPEVEWLPIHPVPADAPDYKSQWGHYARGIPKLHWEYRSAGGELLGVVCRFDKSDGTKDVQPLSFCQASSGERKWRYKAFASPRPLYGLDRLALFADRLDVPVIVVEGEKKADALWHALGETQPVISWPGGCKVPHLAGWEVVGRRSAVCWPDADSQTDKKSGALFAPDDQPGMQAMIRVQQILREQGSAATIVDIGPPGVRPDGWDCANAIEEGWDAEQLRAFMAKRRPRFELHVSSIDAAGGGGGASPPAGAPQGDDARRNWRESFIWRKGERRECVPNVMLVLREHAQWQGVLGFDEFAQRVVKRKPAPFDEPGAKASTEWTDVDDTRTGAWIARHEGFVPSSSMVAEAATETAHANSFHPVIDWLDTLVHDGTPRVEHWLADHLQVPDTPYTRLVARYFLIGMCRRVLEPGCKFDTCLVLEGLQGLKKSSALRILGGEWYSDIELDLQNKDSMSNIRGKWLHEFSEMGSLARAESNRQKSFLSRQIDEFRPSYGRREIRCKRQSAFGGSTNDWMWNKDPTGGRRFWPVTVEGEIDTDGLAAARDQLFAEAYALAKAGERYWPTAEEQITLFEPEQLSRETPEAYVEMLAMWLRSDLMLRTEFTLTDACMEGLKLDAKSMTKDVQTRVGIALRKLECERVERRNSVPRFVYKRPHRNAASSQPVDRAPMDEEVPF